MLHIIYARLSAASHHGEHLCPGQLDTRLTVQQVHADASNFAEGVSKDDAYEQVLLMAEGLFSGQRNWVRLPLSCHHVHC